MCRISSSISGHKFVLEFFLEVGTASSPDQLTSYNSTNHRQIWSVQLTKKIWSVETDHNSQEQNTVCSEKEYQETNFFNG